jgi:signal transduction histidine kinase
MKEENQYKVLQAVYQTQESERKRLAADLHDSVGQVLSTIKLNLHRLEKLGTVAPETLPSFRELLTHTRELSNQSIVEIRNIIRAISPPILTDFGLAEALGELSRTVERTTGIEVSFNQTGMQKRLPADVELTLYRITQELFNNTIKHAAATRVDITLDKRDGALSFVFTDDGRGFSTPNDTFPPSQGLGLRNIEHRVWMLKGWVTFQSAPGAGTTVRLEIGLHPA